MNDKIKAILLQIASGLKKSGWKLSPDGDISIQSELSVPMIKIISVGTDRNKHVVETHIVVKLETDDEITYFPSYSVYANIEVNRLPSKDIVEKMKVSVAFTEKDAKDTRKANTAASKIDGMVQDTVDNEYHIHIDKKTSGMDDDDDERYP